MIRRALLVALLGVLGCGHGGLHLTLIDASVQRPSNVAVYFTVDTSSGDPVPGLTAEQFRIYEDNAPVSVLESKQTILNPEMSATHFTLLLVDMSGSVTESGDVPVIVQASHAFDERVSKVQKVAVYAFDGSPELYAVAPWHASGTASSGLDQLSTFKARDPSTNLNGAIVEGLKLLHAQLRGASTPLSFGTLVVFTDGTDRAQRVTHDQLHKALDDTDIDVVVIGVGAEIDSRELGSIGRDGAIVSKDRKQIAASFEQAAARVEAMSKRYYLLGYCSPARAGKHVVRVEANVNGKSGWQEYEFDARGFGPNCDPTRPPSFSIKRAQPRNAGNR